MDYGDHNNYGQVVNNLVGCDPTELWQIEKFF